MFGVGSFFVWWGNEYYDLEIIEEAKEKQKILSVLILGALMLVVPCLGVAVAVIPNRLPVSSCFAGCCLHHYLSSNACTP
jgi:hypothetical protein